MQQIHNNFMTEYLTSFFSLFATEDNQLITMFLSGLFSSTILPGNSEILFSTLVSQNILASGHFYSSFLQMLLLVATLGNSLGSLITYTMGRLFPRPNTEHQSKSTLWALEKSKKYGIFVLLFSWLPIVGDIFCGIAGWLRFNLWQSIFLIAVGKFVRYLFLWLMLYPILNH